MKVFEITEEQIKKAHNAGFIHIKNWFPEVFNGVDYNKPLLSLNDISTVLNNTSPLFYEIKSLAEAKLNPKSKSILAQEYINNIETLCAEIKYSIKK